MKKNYFIKYYRVFKNDTTVTEISTNDFKHVVHGGFKRGLPVALPTGKPLYTSQFHYSLLADESMYYGYLDRANAMEKAKAGALTYITQMIHDVEQGINKLSQYRIDHYDDLNMNLLDSNIQQFRKEMNIK